jgi:hypothetical protein
LHDLPLSLFRLRSGEFLGESDEKPFRPADVAEPIRVLILDDFPYKLRAAHAEPRKRLVDVVHREHDAEVAESVHRGVAVISNGRRREKAGELKPAVAVRRAHHGNLDALIAQSRDTSGPWSFDRGAPFQLEAELPKELNRLSKIIDDDTDIVHPFERHLSNLQSVREPVWADEGDAKEARPSSGESQGAGAGGSIRAVGPDES